MREYILALSLLSIFLLFPAFPVVGDNGEDNPQRNDEVYRLLNADYGKGLNEFNVLNIEVGQTTRKDIERIFGQPIGNGRDEYVYQNIKANGLYALDKKVEYITAMPLMIAVGFPEASKVSVDEHPNAYNDYQYLIINFDQMSKVNRVVYKHFKNVFLSYFDEKGGIVHCYAIDPPTHSAGWRKCSNQELFLKGEK